MRFCVCHKCKKSFAEYDLDTRTEDAEDVYGVGSLFDDHHDTYVGICPECGSDDLEAWDFGDDYNDEYMFRVLEHMPFDKVFTINGNEQFCHATGYEVCCIGDDFTNRANWFNEYVDSEDNYYYGW